MGYSGRIGNGHDDDTAMDALIAAAGRALAKGDPLDALNRIALREDASALALRGIALAQLGDLALARERLRDATRAFGSRAVVARARCVVAEAEIALVSRDLGWSAPALGDARTTLEAHGDLVNASHARHLEARHLLLRGRLDAADQMLAAIDPAALPPALRAAHELVLAGVATRRLKTGRVHAALARAEQAARAAGIPALLAEIEAATRVLHTPAARQMTRGNERPLLLADVEALLASQAFVVDACRHVVRHTDTLVSLTRRPVLFALVRILGEAWPVDVPRETLIKRAFRTRYVDETHRARLRVEIGRLRTVLRSLASVNATRRGFSLVPDDAHEVVVLAPPDDTPHADVLALLADGEAWSSSALAFALGVSQRTAQRSLDALATTGKVQAYGRGRARRWMAGTIPGFTTTLLLPGPLPSG
ncbi:helix-turn-helix domain-containing protein [Halomonas sabkhae]|uniref:helix-turn-helix domain-containing protein n=1 Tax=Halomonas sabkhae TaxID=626223 RepID=UPI0025B37911|nr:helix-turn-helix domain-containing protein [Halomonas sabkhae]MDN3524709.1 helix-turn-helix domain-containing protein [Halomonas sabkhae]